MGLPARTDQPDSMEFEGQGMGRADTLHYNICTYVVTEQYDRAIETLREILEAEHEFPQFRDRVERYVLHSIDLVNAIRAKRKFPGASYLTMAKRQELNIRFREHFEELQKVLKRIEKTQVDLRVADSRSTLLVVQALVVSVLAIFVVGFFLEVIQGLAESTWIVLDDGMTRVFNWITKKAGL